MPKKAISPNSMKNLAQANQSAKNLTKECLETALLGLLETKTLSQITISELVNRAGVSRNAFYRHYKSKEDIFFRRLTRTLQNIFRGLNQFDPKTQLTQAWAHLLAEVKKEATIFQLIIQNQLQPILIQKVTKRLKAYQRLTQTSYASYRASFFSNGIIALIGNWLSDGMTTSIEELAAMRLPLLPS